MALAQTLQAEFPAARLRIDTEGEELGDAGDLRSSRTHGERPQYVPVTPPTSTGLELYGYVSFVRGEYEPEDFAATRRLHRGDGGREPGLADRPLRGGARRRRGEGGRSADMTLVGARP